MQIWTAITSANSADLFKLNQVNQQTVKGGAIHKLMDKIIARSKSSIRYMRQRDIDESEKESQDQIHQLIEEAKVRGRTLAMFEWANITKSNSSLGKNASKRLFTKRSRAAENLLIEW